MEKTPTPQDSNKPYKHNYPQIMDTDNVSFNIRTFFDTFSGSQFIEANISGQIFRESSWGSNGSKAIEAFGIALAEMGRKIQIQVNNMPK